MITRRGWLITKVLAQTIFTDPSSLTLIAANLFSVYLSARDGWDIGPLYQAFVAQFFMLGIVTAIKIFLSKPNPTESYEVMGQERPLTKFSAIIIFILLYGFFFAGSLIWISAHVPLSLAFVAINLSGSAFALHHTFSFFYNYKSDRALYPSPNDVMGLPLIRIIPLFVGIVVSAFLYFIAPILGVLTFLIIKTSIDILTHYAEHSKKMTLEETRQMLREAHEKYPEIYG